MKIFKVNNSVLFTRRTVGVSFLKVTLLVCLYCSLFVISFPVCAEASTGSVMWDVSPNRIDISHPASSEGKSDCTAKLRIAVLNMEGLGTTTLEAETISNHMRSQLEKTGLVTTIGQIEMKKTLKEMGFPETDRTSVEWIKEAGRLLGVHQVMKGSLGQIGESYVIDLRLFDVESGAVTKSITRAYRGEADNIINDIERLVWDIANTIPRTGQFYTKNPPFHSYPLLAVNMSNTEISRHVKWTQRAGGKQYALQESVVKGLSDQSESIIQKLWLKLEGNSGVLLGGGILSYVAVKGLVALIDRGETRSEIGLPPSFPDVPNW